MKTKPLVATIWFDRHSEINRYKQYSQVWEYTAYKFLKESKIICKSVEPPDYTRKCPVFHRGSRKIGPSKTLSWLKKIDMWEQIQEENVLRPMLLCDADIAFFDDPWQEVFDFDFDIGICGNNTGAVYFRGNKKSREFMTRWWVATHYLVDRPELYQEFDKRYKGLDQASLGYILESGNYNAKIVKLPRRFHSVWNDCQHPAYVMHYHSRLKTSIFNPERRNILPEEVKYYHDKWLQFYKEAEE